MNIKILILYNDFVTTVEGEDHPMFMSIKINEKVGSKKTLGISKLNGNIKECLLCEQSNCQDPPNY